MGLSNILFTIVLAASLVCFGFSARRLISYLQSGKPDDRFDHPLVRLQRVVKIALLQTKLLREPLAGILHIAIFWGFLALIAAVVESICEGLTGHFSLRFLGGVYSLITFTQEIFCILVVVSVALALWRRFVSRVKRLRVGAHGSADAAVILFWIFLIVSTLLFQNAARVSLGIYPEGPAHPVSSAMASLFSGNASAEVWSQIFWWSHILLVLGFLNYLPYSKHLHVLTSIPKRGTFPAQGLAGR